MVSSCIWEYPEPIASHGNGGEVSIFARSAPELDSPDIQLLQLQFPVANPELSRLSRDTSRILGNLSALLRPHSVGRLRLTGAQTRRSDLD